MAAPTPPVAVATILVEPHCPACGWVLAYARPWAPADPPRTLRCGGCGTIVMASLSLEWYIGETVARFLFPEP